MLKNKSSKLILSNNISLNLDSTKRGKNMFFIGRNTELEQSILIPNIKERDISFITTVSSDKAFHDLKNTLDERGYIVKFISDTDKDSCHYNPFRYLDNDDDIIALAKAINQYRKSFFEENENEDPFWTSLTINVACCILYIVKDAYSENKQNIQSAIEISEDILRETDGEGKGNSGSELGRVINEKAPDDERLKKCYSRICVSNSHYIRSVTMAIEGAFSSMISDKSDTDDNMELEKFNNRKTAILIKDNTFCTAGFIFNQLYNILKNGSGQDQKRHCIFCINGMVYHKIPDLIRASKNFDHPNIDLAFYSGSVNELNEMSIKANSVTDVCDTLVYLSSNKKTAEWMADKCGCNSWKPPFDLYTIYDLAYDKCIIKQHGVTAQIDDRYGEKKKTETKDFCLSINA